ncbi:MAG: ABC transporter ATP-binding protein [Coprococcus sp.]|nr:ABC transporter ATP-binding protein [Coprococcus sp.]
MEIKIENASLELKNNLILDNISYILKGGNRYGLIGHNGSGKTMLLRAICGFVRLNSGNVTIDGYEIGTKGNEFIDNAGVIVGEIDFYKDLSGIDNLRLLAKIRNVIGEEEIKEAISEVGLSGRENIKYRKYSTGMKARLRIAQAIMEKPQVLILDEPFNGLDKAGVESISKVIDEYIHGERMLIITSHHEEDINKLCNTVLEIDGGKLINEYSI